MIQLKFKKVSFGICMTYTQGFQIDSNANLLGAVWHPKQSLWLSTAVAILEALTSLERGESHFLHKYVLQASLS